LVQNFFNTAVCRTQRRWMMKRVLVFFVLMALVPITALAAQPSEPVPDGVMLVTRTLAVTVNGLGTVTSNPEGINCVNGTGQCSHAFLINTSVALLATAPPADEFGSYFFYEWSGDATGSVAAAAVVMDATRNVTAQFVALGPPAFVTVLPAGQGATFYHPVFDPVKNPSLQACRPVAINQDPDLTNLYVGLPVFDQAVDVYIGVAIDGFDDMIVFGVGSSIQLLSAGLVPWKQNLSTELDETLLGAGISTSLLPAGTYHVFLMVTAAGDMSTSHVWETYFEIIHGQSLDPFLVP
jgi:hypothetical protein